MDKVNQQRYLSSMFKGEATEEREYWRQTKARGKNHFIKREMMWKFLMWSMVLVAGEIFGSHTSSSHAIFVASLVMLPVLLLGAYLSASWKWNDFEKKHPE